MYYSVRKKIKTMILNQLKDIRYEINRIKTSINILFICEWIFLNINYLISNCALEKINAQKYQKTSKNVKRSFSNN